MELSIFSLPFIAAVLLAGIMGFSVQRGATCTVAAVEQLIVERRWQRFLAILEAALWVLAGLLLAHVVGVTMALPVGYRISAATLAGGAVLGFGAFVNRGCVFGSIARLGSGEWNYIATPFGFFAGCVLTHAWAMEQSPEPLPFAMPNANWIVLIAALLLGGITLRVTFALLKRDAHYGESFRARLRHALARRVWEPGAATTVIGIVFVGLFLLVGAWAYTDVLAELARGTRMSLLVRLLLLLALFAGALIGGWTAGLFRHVAFSAISLLRCFSGGALMGIGSGLIPGGNDGLLLVGMPLLWPYAWTAFAAMVVTIVISIQIQRIFAR